MVKAVTTTLKEPVTSHLNTENKVTVAEADLQVRNANELYTKKYGVLFKKPNEPLKSISVIPESDFLQMQKEELGRFKEKLDNFTHEYYRYDPLSNKQQTLSQFFDDDLQFKEEFQRDLFSFNHQIFWLSHLLKKSNPKIVEEFIEQNALPLIDSLYLEGSYRNPSMGYIVETPTEKSYASLEDSAKALYHRFIDINPSANNEIRKNENIDKFIKSLVDNTVNFDSVEKMTNYIKDSFFPKVYFPEVTVNMNKQQSKLQEKLQKTFEDLHIYRAYSFIDSVTQKSKDKLHDLIEEKLV
ncbi:MAG: hypothetical protein MK033_01500 [Candidatus Caenarcaniphilales bacterium]|nr:hypothetical protein [Candidatus Caenarcaniphilales bacterium]